MLIVGIGFVFVASVAASVAMIFQKRAHAEPPFYKHIQWWVGITLSACASIVDAVAMRFIRTSTIAVLACMSIPINVVVSWWLLSETTSYKQRIYLASAIVGIVTFKIHRKYIQYKYTENIYNKNTQKIYRIVHCNILAYACCAGFRSQFFVRQPYPRKNKSYPNQKKNNPIF